MDYLRIGDFGTSLDEILIGQMVINEANCSAIASAMAGYTLLTIKHKHARIISAFHLFERWKTGITWCPGFETCV